MTDDDAAESEDAGPSPDFLLAHLFTQNQVLTAILDALAMMHPATASNVATRLHTVLAGPECSATPELKAALAKYADHLQKGLARKVQ